MNVNEYKTKTTETENLTGIKLNKANNVNLYKDKKTDFIVPTKNSKVTKQQNNLIIASLNIRSIRKKLNELEIVSENLKRKPHIIITITESWLREEELKFFNIKTYQSIGNCRSTHRGGGIIIFLRNDINFKILKNEKFEKSHLILINLISFNIK